MRLTAVTYEAAYHCVDCAEKRFGEMFWMQPRAVQEKLADSEGNPPFLVWDYMERPTDENGKPIVEVCDDCFKELDL